MNYADLIKDADKTQRFKQGVRQRVSMAVGLPIGNVEVGGAGRGRGGAGRRLLGALAPHART